MIKDDPLNRHIRYTPIRTKAYEELFEGKPVCIFPYHDFTKNTSTIVIDVFVYRLIVAGHHSPVYVMATNGMSDDVMPECDAGDSKRCEIIQYVNEPNNKYYARGIYDIGWLPHHDNFCIRSKDTIAWGSAVNGISRFTNSLVLDPIWSRHKQALTTICNDDIKLLWHIPITTLEYQYKKNNGTDALLDRLDENNIGWIFNPDRPEVC